MAASFSACSSTVLRVHFYVLIMWMRRQDTDMSEMMFHRPHSHGLDQRQSDAEPSASNEIREENNECTAESRQRVVVNAIC